MFLLTTNAVFKVNVLSYYDFINLRAVWGMINVLSLSEFLNLVVWGFVFKIDYPINWEFIKFLVTNSVFKEVIVMSLHEFIKLVVWGFVFNITGMSLYEFIKLFVVWNSVLSDTFLSYWYYFLISNHVFHY